MNPSEPVAACPETLAQNKKKEHERALNRARSAKWSASNKDRRREQSRRAEVSRYQKRHPEVVQKACSKYRANHPDRVRQFVAAWKKANREKVQAQEHRRRAILAGLKVHFKGKDVLDCLKLQEWRCFYCLASLFNGYHIEHMTPLSRGGSNGPENIVCSCGPCNLRKGTKTAAEFILGDIP